MPTNLPPDYYRVEEQYRNAGSIAEKISCLEELMRIVPKHKGTDKLRGDLRRRLSRLRETSARKKGASRQVSPFQIPAEGAGQVAVIGPANVGKSSLVQAMTKARPEVADFPFTTTMPTPGMMRFENIQIQLVDTPPLSEHYVDPEMMNLIRRADAALILVDIQSTTMDQLESARAVLEKHRIIPRQLLEESMDLQRVSPISVLVVVNKVDDQEQDEDFQVLEELIGHEWTLVPLSLARKRSFEGFRQAAFQSLDVIRVFSKAPGKKAELDAPFVLPRGSRIQDFGAKLHKDFQSRLKSARIWGQGLYDGQMVGRDHELKDGDIVELKL
jgi:hypothetical protein